MSDKQKSEDKIVIDANTELQGINSKVASDVDVQFRQVLARLEEANRGLKERVAVLENDIRDPRSLTEFFNKYRWIVFGLIIALGFVCIYFFQYTLNRHESYIKDLMTYSEKNVSVQIDKFKIETTNLIEKKIETVCNQPQPQIKYYN